jgi:hypothetical protein
MAGVFTGGISFNGLGAIAFRLELVVALVVMLC